MSFLTAAWQAPHVPVHKNDVLKPRFKKAPRVIETEEVALSAVPPELRPHLAAFDLGDGRIQAADVADAAVAFADAKKGKVRAGARNCLRLTCVLIASVVLLFGVVWGVVVATKDTATNASGGLVTTSGRLVTVNTRVTLESLPITSMIPSSRLRDLAKISVKGRATESNRDVVLELAGTSLTRNASGYPILVLATIDGDITVTGSVVTADWAALAGALGVPTWTFAPKLSGAFTRANPLTNAADEAYQRDVAVCEYATTGAPAAGVTSTANAQWAPACTRQRAYERGRVLSAVL